MTEVTTHSRPAWLGDCSTCVALLGAFDRAAAGGPESALAEWEAVRVHLIETHPGRVTVYDPACPNCLEWQASLSSRDNLNAPVIRGILERESLIHRAGHLIV